jgi:alanyl-tRNA synthetase
VSEGGIASGVRRIEAVAGAAQVEYLTGVDRIVRDLSGRFKVKPDGVLARVTALQVGRKYPLSELQ